MNDDTFRPHIPNHNQSDSFVPNPPANAPMPEAVKISGKIPAALQAAINAQQVGGDAPPMQPPVMPNMQQPQSMPNNFQQQPYQAAPQPQPMAANPNMGNSNLNSLLEKLKGSNYVYEEVVLPSLGKFYDGVDGPTNGILHIRPMTGEDEQILATPRFVKKGQAINMIFSRCIQEQIRVADLLSVDRTFLLIYLRGISYGTEYEVEIKDPDSDRKFTTIIDLDSLPIERCPDDFAADLSGVLPKSQFRFSYRLSRGRDETDLQEHKDRKLKISGDTGADDSLLFRTAQLVEEIEGVSNKNELLTLLRNLPIQDLTYLRNLVTDPPFGVDTQVSIISPVTSDEFTIELPLEANFFFPRNRKKEKTQA
jgi:hypothetical protein